MCNRNSLNTTGTNYEAKIPRYEELAVPRIRVDRTSKDEPFKVKRRALSYQITDSMNRLAQPRRCSSRVQDNDAHNQRNTTFCSKTLKPKSSENDRKVAGRRSNVAERKYSKS